MIRVFAGKTKWTPRDPKAFYGDSSMYAAQQYGDETPVMVSCTFTWDKRKAVELAQAESRLERVYDAGNGFLPFAMLFDGKKDDPEWRALQRKWCRPAAYRKNLTTKGIEN